MGGCGGRPRRASLSLDLQPRAIAGLCVLVPCLPYRAWRLLLEYLQCDSFFCNNVIPVFHQRDPHLSLYIKRHDEAARSNEGEQRRRRSVVEQNPHNRLRRAQRVAALALRAQHIQAQRDAKTLDAHLFRHTGLDEISRWNVPVDQAHTQASSFFRAIV